MSEKSSAKPKHYPFPAVLDAAGVKKPVEVFYIASVGIIVNLASQFTKVGQQYVVDFALPGMQTFIHGAKMRVVKTYDRATDPRGQKVDRMAELQFESLTFEQKSFITAFVKAIGQK